MAPQVKIDPEAVRALAELLRETDLTEIEYQVDSLRIKVLRSVTQAVVPVVPASPQSSQPVLPSSVTHADVTDNLANHPGVIEAQMVGTVYLSPGPGTEQFVTVGSTVTQGQTLFIIEAMKVMNMIKAPHSGVVKHIFVKDAQPVEYGDPVLIIE